MAILDREVSELSKERTPTAEAGSCAGCGRSRSAPDYPGEPCENCGNRAKPVAKSWDPAKHARAPKGATGGGRFTSGPNKGKSKQAVERGRTVKNLLRQLGYDVSDPAKAIEQFQHDYGLKTDGKVGPETKAGLQMRVAGQRFKRKTKRRLRKASDKGAEPFSSSRTSNWVARAGGLPHYIQHVAHDLMEEHGMTESRAIGMAVGIIKNWAHGHNGKGGSVSADTQTAAAKALAEWEAKKAGTHVAKGDRVRRPLNAYERDLISKAVDVEKQIEEISKSRNDTGCMVALYPSRPTAKEIAVPDGEPPEQLHITLAYLGDAKNVDPQRLNSVVKGWAESTPLMQGELGGTGTFRNSEETVSHASADIPHLEDHRHQLARALDAAGLPVSRDHGFVPHMTLGYGGDDAPPETTEVPGTKLTFDRVAVVHGQKRTTHRFRGVKKATVTTGDFGGAGQAPLSVEQVGRPACPFCGKRHPAGKLCPSKTTKASGLIADLLASSPVRKFNSDQKRWPKGTPGIGGRWMPEGMPDSAGLIANKVLEELGRSKGHGQIAETFNEAAQRVDWKHERSPNKKITSLLDKYVVSPLKRPGSDKGIEEHPAPGPMTRKLLGSHRDTQQHHQINGEYTEERRGMHAEIIRTSLLDPLKSLLGQEHSIVQKLQSGDPLSEQDRSVIRAAAEQARRGKRSQILFMAGGTASGKSSILKSNPDLRPQHAVGINPDDIKEQLPEFKKIMESGESYAAMATHEESSDVSKMLIREAKDLGLNQIRDATGNADPGKFQKKIREAAKSGDVHVAYTNLSTDEAVKRAKARAVRTGRMVPISEIRKMHRGVSINFRGVRQMKAIKSLRVFDNSGASPALIASGGRGKLKIRNRAAMRRFTKKAHE